MKKNIKITNLLVCDNYQLSGVYHSLRSTRNLINLNQVRHISKKAHLQITKELDEILIGTMLGDLTAEKPKQNSNTRLHFKQSIINKVYIDHLFDIFKEYCGSKPLVMSKFDKRANKQKTYSAIKFQTLSLPCFNRYRDLFYQNNLKIVPLNLDELLTAKGLSY